jgi:hypothetical protein
LFSLEFFSRNRANSAGVTIAQLQDTVREMRFRKTLLDISDRADRQDFETMARRELTRYAGGNVVWQLEHNWDEFVEALSRRERSR